MTHIPLTSTKNRYWDSTACNKRFLTSMSRDRKEGEYIDFLSINKRVEKISSKLRELSKEEKEEWVEIHEGKIRELSEMFPQRGSTVTLSKQSKTDQYSKALRESLHVLVKVCDLNQINYDSDMIGKVIQGFYFGQYKQEVLKQMEDAGYSINQFKVLHYEEPSFFNSLCCCWDPSSRVE